MATRSTPMRTDFGPKETRLCSGGLAACLPGLGGPRLPPGWSRHASEGELNGVSGASGALSLPPGNHPFWTGKDVAEQTATVFAALQDEKDAVAGELATALAR